MEPSNSGFEKMVNESVTVAERLMNLAKSVLHKPYDDESRI